MDTLQQTKLSQQEQPKQYQDIRGTVIQTPSGPATILCPSVGGICIEYPDGKRRDVIWPDLLAVMNE